MHDTVQQAHPKIWEKKKKKRTDKVIPVEVDLFYAKGGKKDMFRNRISQLLVYRNQSTPPLFFGSINQRFNCFLAGILEFLLPNSKFSFYSNFSGIRHKTQYVELIHTQHFKYVVVWIKYNKINHRR